jgi:hypothetical protein
MINHFTKIYCQNKFLILDSNSRKLNFKQEKKLLKENISLYKEIIIIYIQLKI